MVPGGLLVTSSTTRLTSATSFVMRVEILASDEMRVEQVRISKATPAPVPDTGADA